MFKIYEILKKEKGLFIKSFDDVIKTFFFYIDKVIKNNLYKCRKY